MAWRGCTCHNQARNNQLRHGRVRPGSWHLREEPVAHRLALAGLLHLHRIAVWLDSYVITVMNRTTHRLLHLARSGRQSLETLLGDTPIDAAEFICRFLTTV
jgi:hypothetical protein